MLKRRLFLRATLATLGAAAIPGCGDDDGPNPSTQPPTTTPPRTVEDGKSFFPQALASGDPRPTSVIVWTRLVDPDKPGVDLDLELEVSADDSFETLLPVNGQERLALKSEAAFDNCVKVRLEGKPATTYYYRFVYAKDGKLFGSMIGRTKTAPAEDSDLPVRFAYVSCQDFIGRYYNALFPLGRVELDFFVHLGDYVYETTGDPSFQTPDSTRKLTFGDAAGAITLKTAKGETYQAARTLDNYRDLYRTYRSDAGLQSLHASVPMIAIWDDHEFSDDSWGAHGTYTDGREDELDVARRKAANQAWFEYMPVDYPDDPDFRYDPKAEPPNDIRIHRDFTFGKHVHLVLTDLRSYRPDHQIPEDAFPGAVAFDEAALSALPGGIPASATPYVEVDTYANGLYKGVLVQAALIVGYDAQKVTGKVNAIYINTIVASINASPMAPNPPIPSIDLADPSLERGISFFDLNKVSPYSGLGARNFVHKDAFDVYSRLRFEADPKTQDVMGEAQEKWFLDTMAGSTRTWKFWGNEFCLVPLQIDLRMQPMLPALLQRRFYMGLDAWDGFRDKRDELIGKLAAIGNVVSITGDVHAFFAGTPWVSSDPTKKVVEFVTGAVSSGTFRELLVSQVAADPILSTIPAAPQLANNIDALLGDTASGVNPHLAHADSSQHGFCVVDAGATEVVVTMHGISSEEVNVDYTGKDGELEGKFVQTRFKAVAGKSDVFKDVDGQWKRWDPETLAWV
ncbi:alkaline phosphatase D family protein [Polyangium aurulentum]|uniref:alkaline phosphatase D family protein n=1 Tax=Polyangium aurulentum TaxID=2567896 RepID=UPI0010AEDC82|nr:alkaline phosphatase D family protein [Polyangium aurulentum]UQA58887.1 alkaline phosphatase D family protein [Polyangium aurulentum]